MRITAADTFSLLRRTCDYSRRICAQKETRCLAQASRACFEKTKRHIDGKDREQRNRPEKAEKNDQNIKKISGRIRIWNRI